MATGVMYVVKKREYQLFTRDRQSGEIARRCFPALKGARIKNIVQLGSVELAKLYKDGELLDSRRSSTTCQKVISG
jgi:hypothetical protein